MKTFLLGGGSGGRRGAWPSGSAGGSYINLQDTTPGVAQTGNCNISGVGIFTTGIKTNSVAVNLGSVAPSAELHVASSLTTSPRGIMSAQYSDDSEGAMLHLRKARGTAAAPGVIHVVDRIGWILFSGYDGTNYLEMAGISADCGGNIGPGKIPTILSFWTATDATPSVLTERMTINASGQVSVDGPAAGSYNFTVNGSAYINNSVGVNLSSAAQATELHVASSLTTSPRGIMSAQYTSDNLGARLHLRKARGTVTVPLVITTGDMLGRLVASGYDGTNYLEMAGIDINCEGTIATGRIPTRISFWTATDASPSVLTQRMIINSAGEVGIAQNPASGYKLAVTSIQCNSISCNVSGSAPAFNIIDTTLTSFFTGTVISIYGSGSGGAYPFDVIRNLIIQPRTSGVATDIVLATGLTVKARLVVKGTGEVLVGGLTTGSALLHLAAGTATASTAPLKFTSGVSLTTPEAGAIEFTADDLYFSISTGPARKGIVLNNGTNLTSGRVPFATTNGRLTDAANFSYSGGVLNVPTGFSVGSTAAVADGTYTPVNSITTKGGIITAIS